MFCLCSGNRFFFIFLVSKGYWRLSSVHPIYTLYIGLLLVLHPSLFIQSLSKNYLFSSSRFSGKAFAKVRRFFVTSKFFRKFFFWKNFSEGFQKACGLPFLAPLHIRKVRYSVQHPALSSIASALLSLSSSAALPLESGCKGTDFFLFCNFYHTLFCNIFSGFYLTHWFSLCYKAYFLLLYENGCEITYII